MIEADMDMGCLEGLIPESHKSDLLCSPELADGFIAWFVWQTVDAYGSVKLTEIPEIVQENYHINVVKVREFARKTLVKEAGSYGYFLTDWQREILNKVAEFRQIMQKTNYHAYDIIETLVGQGESDDICLCAAVALADKRVTGLKDVDYQTMYFMHLLQREARANRLSSVSKSVLLENQGIDLKTLFTNERLHTCFRLAKIQTVGDFASLDPHLASDLCFLDADLVASLLDGLHESVKQALAKSIDFFYARFDGKDVLRRYCFDTRHGISEGLAEHTLEEVGQGMGKTRERARQLIEDADRWLVECSNPILTYGSILIGRSFPREKVIDFARAKKAIAKERDLEVFTVACAICADPRIRFDEDLQIFYNAGRTSLHDIKHDTLDQLPDIIRPEDFESRPDFEKKIIRTAYSRENGGFYLRKTLLSSYLITRVLDMFFPTGYRMYDKANYDDLCDCLKREYGSGFPLPTQAQIRGYLNRDELYCQIDKGLYIARSAVKEPDLVFLMTVVSYIQEHGPVVHYRSIFEAFKDEFLALGVDNNYYVKGYLDPHLVGFGFDTQRNYVRLPGENVTSKEVIHAFMHDQPGIFTLQELRNRFPGVRDYVFTFEMNEDKTILLLGNNRFVCLEKCGVTEAGKQILLEELSAALKAGEGVTSTNKVLGRLHLFRPDYAKELGSITSSTGLFSYYQALPEVTQRYSIRRPFIAEDGEKILTTDSLLAEHFLETKGFTIKDCQAYRAKLGISSGNFSFISFVDSLCDDFVLVDRYEAVNRKNFPITQDELNKVRLELLKAIRLRGEFSSTDTVVLGYFPKAIAGHEINVHLIFGIAQTYLQDFFVGTYASSGTDTSYVIKEVS